MSGELDSPFGILISNSNIDSFIGNIAFLKNRYHATFRSQKQIRIEHFRLILHQKTAIISQIGVSEKNVVTWRTFYDVLYCRENVILYIMQKRFTRRIQRHVVLIQSDACPASLSRVINADNTNRGYRAAHIEKIIDMRRDYVETIIRIKNI